MKPFFKPKTVHVVENLSVNYVLSASILNVLEKIAPERKSRNWMLECFRKWEQVKKEGKEREELNNSIRKLGWVDQEIKVKEINQ